MVANPRASRTDPPLQKHTSFNDPTAKEPSPTQTPTTLEISVSEAEFEDEGNFYLKFEPSFWGKPAADKCPRTDVSTPPSRHPSFNPNVFSFVLPEKERPTSAASISNTEQSSIRVVISAIRVEKTKDGSGATINKIGSHTFECDDLSALDGHKTDVYTALKSDPLPGSHSKTVGHLRLVFTLSGGSLHKKSPSSAQDVTSEALLKDDGAHESITAKKPVDIFIHDTGSKSGQKLTLFVHHTWNLPPLTNLGTGEITLPKPFISIKTAKEAATNVRAKLVTNTAPAGREATFGEKFSLTCEEPYSSQQQSEIPEIFISILDESSKRYIAKFNLPIAAKHFPSHRQVNLVLRSVSTIHKEYTPCLRVSVRNEDCAVTAAPQLQKDYTKAMVFLELFLKGVVSALPFGAHFIAVLKITNSMNDYKAKMAQLQNRFRESCPTTFPQLLPAAQLDFDSNGTLISDYPLTKDAPVPFLIHDKPNQIIPHRGKPDATYYQMTTATAYTQKPEWNEHFVFCMDLMSIGVETALIIEIYKDPPITDDRRTTTSNFAIDEIIAFGVVPLGDFSVIPNAETRKVLNVDDIALRFVGQYDGMPGTSNIACALDIKVPENWDALKPETIKPKPAKKEHRSVKTNLECSIEQLLEMVKQEREVEMSAAATAAESPMQAKHMTFTYADVEQRQRLIDKLLHELETRSNAVQKVGQDLVTSKERNAKLEEKIKLLEDKLRESEIKTNKLLNTVDIQDIPRLELEKRYSSMAERLQNEIVKHRNLSAQLEVAQLAQIERNDVEKKYLEMQQAHMAQQKLLHALQSDKEAENLFKATIKKQEHVIGRLGSYLKERVPANIQGKIDEAIKASEPDELEVNLYKVLADENTALKRQISDMEKRQNSEAHAPKLNDIRYHPQPYSNNASAHVVPEATYVEVLMRAESSETRVVVLEEELARNAKRFAKQLADMQKRLHEREHSNRTPPEYAILKDIKKSDDKQPAQRKNISWTRPASSSETSAPETPPQKLNPITQQKKLRKRESEYYF
ncbi:Coiled-coil domain-containing protein 33 [Chytriomyces hyalinus]|nr:Coiled-coil domain-containing protein 33 [Chytriomyces hyalinus]